MTSVWIKEVAEIHNTQEVKQTKTRTSVLWLLLSTPRSKHQSSSTISLRTSTRTTDVTSNRAQMHSSSVRTWQSLICKIVILSSQTSNYNSLTQYRKQLAVTPYGSNSSQLSQLSLVVSLPRVSSMIPSSSIVKHQWTIQAKLASMIPILLGNLMLNTSSRTWILRIGNPSSGLT